MREGLAFRATPERARGGGGRAEPLVDLIRHRKAVVGVVGAIQDVLIQPGPDGSSAGLPGQPGSKAIGVADRKVETDQQALVLGQCQVNHPVQRQFRRVAGGVIGRDHAAGGRKPEPDRICLWPGPGFGAGGGPIHHGHKVKPAHAPRASWADSRARSSTVLALVKLPGGKLAMVAPCAAAKSRTRGTASEARKACNPAIRSIGHRP